MVDLKYYIKTKGMHISSMRMFLRQFCLNSMFVQTPFAIPQQNTKPLILTKTYFLENIQKTNIWWHLKYFDDPFYV